MLATLLRRLRPSEWLSFAFFAYIGLLTPWFHNRPLLTYQPYLIAAIVLLIYLALAAGETYGRPLAFNRTRDWVPIGVTLMAYQEMDLFQPARFNHIFEAGWIRQDVALFHSSFVTAIIDAGGYLLPFYLEACYFLVYGIAAFSLAALYAINRRQLADHFYLFYLAGTLGAYAFFPFFPSEPPRLLYPGIAAPALITPMRSLNLWLLRKATIHVSVFPSAHVSSAFSAAWALFLLVPDRKIFGTVALIYAISVSAATVYGRYHYTADAVAGIAVSLVTSTICAAVLYRRSSLADPKRIPLNKNL